MKIWAPPFWQSGSSLIWNKAGMFVKVHLTVSNLAYVGKKARGRLAAPLLHAVILILDEKSNLLHISCLT